MRLLAGDIGGTNARLVLYEAPDVFEDLRNTHSIKTHHIISQKYYKNDDFQSFAEVFCSFLAIPTNNTLRIHSCCLAVAGPVSNNQINFTNREGWIIDGKAISEDFDINSVVLVNDFVANGYGLLSLSEEDVVTLQKGKTQSSGGELLPIALVGAGTGLGECYLAPEPNGQHSAFPTEGGHVEFAPQTKLEKDLLSFLHRKLNTRTELPQDETDVLPHVSIERIVSGKGLENIYEFLREKYVDQIDTAYDAKYDESSERGELIGTEKDNYLLFQRALEIMYAVFGGEVGNVALKYLPYGGVYICGGITAKNIELISSQGSEFMARFLKKGRMSSIMTAFPVHVVMKEDLGLRGAHMVASRNGADLLENDAEESSELCRLGEKLVDDKGLTLRQEITQTVQLYPLSYAIIVCGTSAVTAAACLAGLFALRRMGKV